MADEDGQPDEGGQEELFPQGSLTGGKTTLKTLVKTGQGHKLRGGLPDPDRQVRALVTGVFQKEETLAERDDPGNPLKVTGWKTTAKLRVEYVEHIPDDDAGLILQRFKAMLEVEPRAAAELLDRLKVMASEQLALA